MLIIIHLADRLMLFSQVCCDCAKKLMSREVVFIGCF